MVKNVKLNTAKSARCDEFYTCIEDIEDELRHYTGLFRDKVVLCNCDNPYNSNFFRYFAENFSDLGLKKLICTCYDPESSMYCGDSLFACNAGDIDKQAFLAVLDRAFMSAEGKGLSIGQILQRRPPVVMSGDGDFRSDECIKQLKDADIVVTNPPFSLFREYVELLDWHRKKFLILGNVNAITYSNIFPLFAGNRLTLGVSITGGDTKFYVPNHYGLDADKCGIDREGKRYIRVSGVRWFTNLEHPILTAPLVLTEKYIPERYPKYDNYNAINIDKTSAIPADYDGVMGVPITFMDKYCPSQFRIVGFTGNKAGAARSPIWGKQTPASPEIAKPHCDFYHRATCGGKEVYFRIFVKRI